ncbi:hypothetical protein B484DRAFT_468730, partial [Ochromonadaceae sp. CCMP2298]
MYVCIYEYVCTLKSAVSRSNYVCMFVCMNVCMSPVALWWWCYCKCKCKCKCVVLAIVCVYVCVCVCVCVCVILEGLIHVCSIVGLYTNTFTHTIIHTH